MIELNPSIPYHRRSVRPLPVSGTEAIVLFRYAYFNWRMYGGSRNSIDDLLIIDFNDATSRFGSLYYNRQNFLLA